MLKRPLRNYSWEGREFSMRPKSGDLPRNFTKMLFFGGKDFSKW